MWSAGLRHFAYAAGWKKFEPMWDLVIRAKRAGAMLPVLEAILGEFGRRWPSSKSPRGAQSRAAQWHDAAAFHPIRSRPATPTTM